MKVPGLVWSIALAFLPVVIQLLQGADLGKLPWAAGAVVVLTAVLKLIEIYAPKPAGDVTARDLFGAVPEPPVSDRRRFFLGG